MKITIYTISDCPFCAEEKSYLTSHNLPFEEKNLETNKDYLTEMLAISNNFAGTPVTKIEKDDGQSVVLKGFTKEEFDTTLGLSEAPAQAPMAPAAEPATAPVVPPQPTEAAPMPPLSNAAPAISDAAHVSADMNQTEPMDVVQPPVAPVNGPEPMSSVTPQMPTAPDLMNPTSPMATDSMPSEAPTMPAAPTVPEPAAPSPQTPAPNSDQLNDILNDLQKKVNSIPDVTDAAPHIPEPDFGAPPAQAAPAPAANPQNNGQQNQ